MDNEKFFDELYSFEKDTREEYPRNKTNSKYFRNDISFDIVNKIIPRKKWDEIVFSEKYNVNNDEEWVTLVGSPIIEKESFYVMMEALNYMNIKYVKSPNVDLIYSYVEFKFLSKEIRAGKIYYAPDTLYDVRFVPWHFKDEVKNVLTINYVPVPVLAEAGF